MTGKIYHLQNNPLFWTVFLSFILSISSIGCLALIFKRYLSYRENLHRVQTIHISLEDQNQNLNNDNIVHWHNFNNQSYNSPLLSCREIIALFTIPIFYIIIMLLPVFVNFEREEVHLNIFYAEVIIEYIVGIVIPFYVLMKKNGIRIYFLNKIKNLSHYMSLYYQSIFLESITKPLHLTRERY